MPMALPSPAAGHGGFRGRGAHDWEVCSVDLLLRRCSGHRPASATAGVSSASGAPGLYRARLNLGRLRPHAAPAPRPLLSVEEDGNQERDFHVYLSDVAVSVGIDRSTAGRFVDVPIALPSLDCLPNPIPTVKLLILSSSPDSLPMIPKSPESMSAILDRVRLPSILLSQKPHFTARKNDTTATAKSICGYTMAVSFWLANPPQLSLFSIHCFKPQDLQDRVNCGFSKSPHVVGADGPFVLLRAALNGAHGRREYFLYSAAGDTPSLHLIPSPDKSDDLRVREFGILGHGDGNNYFLADLRHAPLDSDDGYQLRVYSSETKSWSTRTLRNPCPGIDRVTPDKVITLAQGVLGWVDLSHGLLVCDLLLLLQQQDEGSPVPPGAVSFIPLPPPLPGNRYKLKYPIPPNENWENNSYIHIPTDKSSSSASWFRDLACVNGMLKFVEMENPAPPENKDNIIHDSDLIKFLKQKAADGDSKQQLLSFRDSWRAVTWTREVSPSSHFWRQTSSAPFGADLKNGYSAFPIISPDYDGDDIILYLKFVEEPSHGDQCVAALDLGNMALKAIGRYYIPDGFKYSKFYHERGHPFRACTLSRHLNMTPGILVSECHKITEDSSSANHPSEKTSIRGSSLEPRTTIQGLSELARKFKRPRNAAESFIQNDHISQVHPSEKNLTQQRTWDAGNPLWPHQNNLPPQQCSGPCGPGYASLAPVHGGPNYQPVWPPSKHHLTSSSEFKPHESPQPCFNCCDVTSYHGYSQQLPSPNSFANGAHTRYGNYQQQWQQLPLTAELPIGASGQHPTPPQWQQLPPTVVQPIGASWQHPTPPVQRQPTPLE